MRVLERPSPNELVLELIHVDTSFVNALRRILLAEVPTVALEQIYMWTNSSILHDEVLAHRLGLVPLKVDARLLDEPDDGDDDEEEDFSPTDRNTVVFRLAVSCPNTARNSTTGKASSKKSKQADDAEDDDDDDANADVVVDSSMDIHDTVSDNASLAQVAEEVASQHHHATTTTIATGGTSGSGTSAGTTGSTDASGVIPPYVPPADRPYTKHVYSRDLVWVPQGDQQERFPAGIRPIHDDILLAKLRPGQSIELEAHGQRGIGKDHAKYSPVATASYRLMPKIEILQDIYDQMAEELVHVYEPGVFALVPTDPTVDPAGTRQKAKLVNPYACTMSRNYMRNPVLAKSIKMSRIADHFIFSVESVGTYSPGVLVAEALRTLQRKCHSLMYHVEESQQRQQQVGTAVPMST